MRRSQLPILYDVIALYIYRNQRQKTSQSLGISDNYKAIDWFPMNVQLLKHFYHTAPLSMQCNASDGSRYPVSDSSEGYSLSGKCFVRGALTIR